MEEERWRVDKKGINRGEPRGGEAMSHGKWVQRFVHMECGVWNEGRVMGEVEHDHRGSIGCLNNIA